MIRALLFALVLAGVQTPVPDFDREGMHPSVARLLDGARKQAVLHADDVDSWWKLGALYDAHELLAQAEACYRRAHELEPGEFRSLYLLALVSDRLGRPVETTLPLFEACAELDPDYAPVWLNLGLALARGGRDADALEAYRRALAIDPDLGTARRCLGQLLLARGEVEEARAALETVARRAPEDHATSVSLARVYALLDQRERAREMAERSRSQEATLTYSDPVRAEVIDLASSAVARFQRAERYRQVGDLEAAVAELEELLVLRPDHPGAHVLLGDLYLDAGRTERAKQHLRRAAALEPENAGVRVALGRLLLAPPEDGPWVKTAVSHLLVAVELAPEDREAREFLGVGLTRRGRHEAAAAHFARAAADDRPLEERSFLMWGSSLFALDRRDEAVTVFRDAILFHPDSGHVRYGLGVAYEQAGRVDEAIEAFERALELGTELPARQRLESLRAGGAPMGR